MEERQSIHDFTDRTRLATVNAYIRPGIEIHRELTNRVHRLERAVWFIGVCIVNVICGLGMAMGLGWFNTYM